MIERAGLHGDRFGPVRPRRLDRRAQEPAADALPRRMLHHAEIGELGLFRQMRLDVEEAGRRAVEIEHADVAAGRVDGLPPAPRRSAAAH